MSVAPPRILVLGSSSGMGAACCREFAGSGYEILGVHLDRRAAMPAVAALIRDIEQTGGQVRFFNENAADDQARARIIQAISGICERRGGGVDVLLHSLAFGTIAPFFASGGRRSIRRRQLEMTLDVMASSLVYWSRDLLASGLMFRGARIFALTSQGSGTAWKGYGPVSMAKAALEAAIRQMAVELAPHGITANCLQPGVCDTPALRVIDGHQSIIRRALARNPHRRLTTPQDVARCLLALAAPGTAWMTGNVIRVDGGEGISG